MIIDLLGRGDPILPPCLRCGSVGTAWRKRSKAAFRPSRYLRSTVVCGMRDERALSGSPESLEGLVECREAYLRDLPRFRGAEGLELIALPVAEDWLCGFREFSLS